VVLLFFIEELLEAAGYASRGSALAEFFIKALSIQLGTDGNP